MKKIILSLLTLFMLISFTGCGKEEPINNPEAKTPMEESKVEELLIKDLEIKYENNESIITAKVENTTNGEVTVALIKIFLYKDNNLIIETAGYIDGSIGAGETKTFQSAIDFDITDADDVKYEIIREY